jgi:hypothetical protein
MGDAMESEEGGDRRKGEIGERRLQEERANEDGEAMGGRRALVSTSMNDHKTGKTTSMK